MRVMNGMVRKTKDPNLGSRYQLSGDIFKDFYYFKYFLEMGEIFAKIFPKQLFLIILELMCEIHHCGTYFYDTSRKIYAVLVYSSNMLGLEMFQTLLFILYVFIF